MAGRPWAWGKGVGLAGSFGVASRFCDGRPPPRGPSRPSLRSGAIGSCAVPTKGAGGLGVNQAADGPVLGEQLGPVPGSLFPLRSGTSQDTIERGLPLSAMHS